ncbi:MAG: squalene/phytoene synthase family protein [Sandaracinaceae bacterium]|nr:squalene/phytoene synthase family protein [Sandaracinaceae bacterium]MBK8409965.1 squalene/phytoene synthase family protein [Sandaracinaceae bacterium]MBK8590423.1 squalene/phytoene synthase family protein [Sandaracinaceae bacterium]MBP7683424.1 squalene/phytoene synthase family protein [Deltaproteobacteria bacterium]
MTREVDVVVVGAGPAGIAAAAGFAERGASVLLLEAEPNAAKRLAGEWLHPLAASHLRRLGLLADLPAAQHAEGRGFAFFSDDGGAPVLLPYADGERALAMEHADLLGHLRERIAVTPGVTYRPHARLRTLTNGTVSYTLAGATHEVRAGLVVGADGRSSAVRASCFGPRHAPAAVSHMAGVLLTGVRLPHEGYGHVMLGGPGPLLMYRVSEACVRLCLDVPVGGGARSTEALWHGFGPVLPDTLRHAFRDGLEHGKVVWAANRLTPRSCYGEAGVALVGDAVGTTHPLSAAGMTLGILDAVTLVETGDVTRYATARARSSRVPEVLSQALYEVVTRDDESASGVRDAMVRMWRGSAYERERTMRILAGQEQRPAAFAAAFLKVAGGALQHATRSRDVALLRRLHRAAGLREWARYPLSVAGTASMPAPRRSAHVEADTDPRSLEQLAWSISGAVAAGTWPRAPRTRRTLRALLGKLADLDGVPFTDAPRTSVTRPERTRTVARVLNALLDARCPDSVAVEQVARLLTSAFPYETTVASEAERALRRYSEQVKAAPRVQRPALRALHNGALAGPDWDFCQTALEGVSRSFAQPIAALPPALRVAVTCGYLLCRVADTIEDAPGATAAERDAHFDRFIAALHGHARATEFERELLGWPGTDAELQLAAGLARVIRVLDASPPAMATTVRRWVSEMVGGMRVYAHREAGHDGLRAPLTISDLERYCYFVAGTVGHMLTELFLTHMGPPAAPLERTLRSRAESFGAGLQLVNILKDVTDDRARGWAFVPRELTDLDELTLAGLLDERRRLAAHRSIAPLFDLARAKLDEALEYTLAIPAEHLGVRLFCLLPVFMAARTLMLARDNDDVFTPGRPVKIPRAEVEQLAADCLALATSDELLRTAYASLWQPTLPARPLRSPETLERGDHV